MRKIKMITRNTENLEEILTGIKGKFYAEDMSTYNKPIDLKELNEALLQAFREYKRKFYPTFNLKNY